MAGGDAPYAKAKRDQGFLRFDGASSNLTKDCYQGVWTATYLLV